MTMHERMLQNTIIELGWEVMARSGYSQYLAPSDDHQFRSLENSLRENRWKMFKQPLFLPQSHRCSLNFLMLNSFSFLFSINKIIKQNLLKILYSYYDFKKKVIKINQKTR